MFCFFFFNLFYFRFRTDFTNSAIIRLLNTLVQFLPSLLVSKILRNLQQETAPATLFQQLKNNKSFHLSILLFLCLSSKTIIENQYFDMMTRLGAKVRGTLSSAIYQKALRLGPSSRQNSTVSWKK
jgi:ABC-type transport system involved in cytochrome bd biosynthesis fused ATPase/permease subunit